MNFLLLLLVGVAWSQIEFPSFRARSDADKESPFSLRQVRGRSLSGPSLLGPRISASRPLKGGLLSSKFRLNLHTPLMQTFQLGRRPEDFLDVNDVSKYTVELMQNGLIKRYFPEGKWRMAYYSVLSLVGAYVSCYERSRHQVLPLAVGSLSLTHCDELIFVKMRKGGATDSGVAVQRKQWEGRILLDFFDGLAFDSLFVFKRVTNAQRRLVEPLRRAIDGRKIPVPPVRAAFFPMTLFLLFLLGFSALIVMGFVGRFWTHKRGLLVLTCAAAVAFLLLTLVWLFTATGYQDLGHTPNVPNVPSFAVALLRGIAAVAILSVVAFFSYTLTAAVLETENVGSRRLRILTAITFGAVTLVAGAYSVAMAVVRAFPTDRFIIDASPILLPACMFLFSTLLIAVFIFVLRRRASSAGVTRVFLGAVILMATLYLARVVVESIALFYLWQFGKVALWLGVVSNVLVAAAICLYIGSGVLPALKSRKEGESSQISSDGYKPLAEEADGSVPLQYANF